MNVKKVLTPRILLAVLLILLTVAIRVSKFIPNVAPVAALAIFGGAILTFPWSLIVPLAAMGVADYIIGFDKAEITLTIYGSFILTALLGMTLRKGWRPFRLIGVSLAGSIIFYLTTNAAVWWWGELYPHTADGLTLSYWFAIPFFRYTLLGDMVYAFSLFLALEYIPLAAAYIKKRYIGWHTPAPINQQQ